MNTLLLDLRFGLRMLRRNYEITLIAAIAMAIAIGTASSMFSVVNSVLLQPLPFREPDRLVAIWQIDPMQPGTWKPAAAGNFADWRRLSNSFEAVAAGVNTSLTLTSFEDPDTPLMRQVSYGYFELLGVKPIIGRTFSAEEDRPGGKPVLLLSYELWQRRFGGDPNIVGRTTELDQKLYEIIGVIPADFDDPIYGLTERPQLWFPLATGESGLDRLGNNHYVIGRLAAGVSIDQARQEIARISGELKQQYPDTNRNVDTVVVPMKESVVRGVRTGLLLLFGAVLSVLLIASGNVGNLLLTRSVARHREFAIRRALGATTGYLLRQLTIESLVFMTLCGALGLLLSAWESRVIVLLIPTGLNVPRIDLHIDSNVILFTVAISVLPGLFFALIPILHSLGSDLFSGLNLGGGRSTEGKKIRRLQSTLIVIEVALSLVLLVSAGLMIKSFQNLQSLDQGFDPTNTLTFRVSTRGPDYRDSARREKFFEDIIDRLESLPGVVSVGASQVHPFYPQFTTTPVTLDDQPIPEPGTEPRVVVLKSTTGYINAMKIPLLQGRLFNDDDKAGSLPVAVISRRMAQQLWSDSSPLGRRLTIRDGQGISRQVVGIVGDVRTDSFPPEPHPTVYVPLAQSTAPAGMGFVIRTTANPLSLLEAAKKEVRALDRSMPVFLSRSMEQVIEAMDWRTKFVTSLLALFSLLALCLAITGIYAVLSYATTQKTREIAIRLALGAGQQRILKMILKSAFLLVMIGIVIGLLGALIISRLLQSQLYGISPGDPTIYAAISILLVGVGLIAGLIPALRAIRVNPAMILRE